VNRLELEHVIKAAADITGDEIVVIGSQAILGQFPSAPATMLRSMEADLYPKNDPDRAIEIDGAIGDGSRFHETYGYYAHGVGPETAQAPVGWEGRLLEIQIPPMLPGRDPVTAWFLEVHDLALAKLAAGREKDIEFVTEALIADLVDAGRLRRGVELMPEKHRELTGQRLEGVITRIERQQANSMA
jgi:hypothetical protein